MRILGFYQDNPILHLLLYLILLIIEAHFHKRLIKRFRLVDMSYAFAIAQKDMNN